VSGDDGHPGPSIEVSDRQGREVDTDALIELAGATLHGEGIEHGELSVSLVDDDEMTELHRRYMDEDGPTDVLSFPMDADDRNESGVRLLGDIVIAPAVAARNHPEDPAREIRLLLVHGILHLLGYDHEEDDERAAMWARQERYSGVSVP
jgi:probable rRNA maturation factor